MHKKVSKIRNKALPSNLVRYFLQVISFAPDGECELRDINLLFILTYIRCCNGMVIDNLSFNSEPRNFINFALLITKQHSKYTAIMLKICFATLLLRIGRVYADIYERYSDFMKRLSIYSDFI